VGEEVLRQEQRREVVNERPGRRCGRGTFRGRLAYYPRWTAKGKRNDEGRINIGDYILPAFITLTAGRWAEIKSEISGAANKPRSLLIKIGWARPGGNIKRQKPLPDR
jgi:hypothetical protein